MTGTTLGEGLVQNLPSNRKPTQATGNVSEFGTFNFALDCFDGFKYSVTALSFNLHTTRGGWTSESAILTSNAKNFEVVGHVYTRDANGEDRKITGYAAVPEPTTMIAGALLLLPFGLSTLRMLRRKA